jgi:hypothetical protein
MASMADAVQATLRMMFHRGFSQKVDTPEILLLKCRVTG